VYVLLLVLIDELFEEDITHTVQIMKIISLTVSVATIDMGQKDGGGLCARLPVSRRVGTPSNTM